MGAVRAARGGPLAGAARLAGAALAGYALGGLPSADVATRLATGGATDLRTAGSGNPGAVNAMKVLGGGWGTAVLAADIAKGAVASAVGRAVAGGTGSHVGGTAAVVGHCFPAASGFKGGKGVAASVGQCLATFPAYFPIDLAVAALSSTGPWRRRASVVTLLSSGAWIGGAVLWWRKGWPNLWGPRPTVALPLAAGASSAIILYRFATANAPRREE
jgi:glycerol-3-phosphate acyltransferase PlsY